MKTDKPKPYSSKPFNNRPLAGMQPASSNPPISLSKNYDHMKEGDMLAIMDPSGDKVSLYGSFISCDAFAGSPGDPRIYYIPRYDSDGNPISRQVPSAVEASYCRHAEEVIKQTIFEARQQITALEAALIKIGGSVC